MSITAVSLGGVKVTNALWVGLAVFIIYKLVTWYRRYTAWVAIYDKLPGKREKHWLWGHVHEHPGAGQDGLEYELQLCVQNPRIHRYWMTAGYCLVFVECPDTVKKILKCSAYLAPKPRGQGTSYEVGIKWLGEGLLIANGDRWARNRRLLTPAFHFDILQNYSIIQNQCTDVLLGKIEKFCSEGKTFEAFNHFGLSSLDIILKCAFSYKTDCQIQGDKHPYVQAVLRLSELWMERSLNPLLFLDFVYFYLTPQGREFSRLCNFVHGIAEEIINARRKTIEAEGLPEKSDGKQKRNLDFLDIILTAKDEDGKGLSDLDIRNEVDTFLFEGHDTTTSAISFIMYSLAEHQDIQERCRAEVDSILEGRDNDYIEWKDLGKFEYLTMCIKEGLRCHSPVFFMQRQVTEDIEIEGYHIPAWTNIAINIYNVHHNSTVWGPDHMEYKPDRFLPENISKMDTFAFIPFSAGARNCIGQNFAMNEMKIVIARLLHRYKFELDPDHVVRKRMGVVMRTENGILLKPTRR